MKYGVSQNEPLTQPEANSDFTPWASDDANQSIPHRFEQQVLNYPNNIALKCGNFQLTYTELDKVANQIANLILARSDRAPGHIAIYMDQEPMMIASIFGILKSGNAYVALDPQHPPYRNAEIMKDSQAYLIITNNKNADIASELASTIPIINVDLIPSTTNIMSPGIDISPDATACLLYTSGSTGLPKGVIQTHRNILYYLIKHVNSFKITNNDIHSLFTPLIFCAALFDTMVTLLNGATLAMVNVRKEGLEEFSDWLLNEKITVIRSTPTLIRNLVNVLADRHGLPNLRVVFIGGESTFPDDFERLRKYCSEDCVFIHGYGATEFILMANFLYKDWKDSATSPLPVGYPPTGTQILLTDESKQEITEGIGEIVIRSNHITPGYWNRPDLNTRVFKEDSLEPGIRYYSTGDIGYKLGDGGLVCLGRKDHQIKIRGFRVEPAEIEEALRKMGGVREAAVKTWEGLANEKTLAAYVVFSPQNAKTSQQVQKYLRTILPDYMIPASVIILKRMPHTTSGKIDRLSLPDPKTAINYIVTDQTNDQCQGETELELAQMWQQILGLDTVLRNQPFYDIGGHSLSALQLMLEIERTFNRKIPQAVYIRNFTIAELADEIRQREPRKPWKALLPIKKEGSKPPLYCIHAIGGNIINYRTLAKYMDIDQPIYGIRALGSDDNQTPQTSCVDMANIYLEEVLNLQPEGPYYLAGHSMGGLIAYEMAQKIQALGKDVALLAMFDTYYPEATIMLPFKKRIRKHIEIFRELPTRKKTDYLIDRAKRITDNTSAVYKLLHPASKEAPKQFDINDAHSIAANTYKVQPYSGNITYFSSQEKFQFFAGDSVELWSKACFGQMTIISVPGSHSSMMKEPNIQALATELVKVLRELDETNKELSA